jgi:C4-dicarboxylate transporter, DctQ subunit
MKEPFETASGLLAFKMNGSISKVEKIFDIAEDWFSLFSAFLVLILMISSVAEILGRYLFNTPIPGYVESVELMLPVIVYLGITYAERMGKHVRMEMFVTKVLKGKSQDIAEIANILLSLIIYLIIGIYSVKFFLSAYINGDVTTILFLPTWPAKICICIGCFSLCARFLFEITHHLYHLLQFRGGQK